MGGSRLPPLQTATPGAPGGGNGYGRRGAPDASAAVPLPPIRTDVTDAVDQQQNNSGDGRDSDSTYNNNNNTSDSKPIERSGVVLSVKPATSSSSGGKSPAGDASHHQPPASFGGRVVPSSFTPLKTFSTRNPSAAAAAGSTVSSGRTPIDGDESIISGKIDAMDRVSVSSPRPPGRHPRPSRLLVASGWMAFVSSLWLLVAYSAPYWLESYDETRSETQFVRLGLWEVCFNRYMHPPYQYDEVFDGCHWIHGYYFQNIRDWLMPGWFMFTQAMLTLGLMFELTALIVLSVLLMRYLLRYEIVVLTAAFVLEALTALLLFLGVSVFGGMAFSRYWLLYPNFNHLSWGYAFAVIAMFFHAFTACMLLKEAFNSKERRRRDNNLVYNMQPRGEPMRY